MAVLRRFSSFSPSTSNMRACILVILLLGHFLLVVSQSCQVYDIRNNAFCLVRTDYPVFVASGSSQDAIGATLLTALNLTSSSYGQNSGGALDQISKQLAPACLASYTALICSLYIPGCNSSATQVQPVPSPPCLSSCTDVERDCGPVVSNLLKVNCSATVSGSNMPLFLNDSDSLPYSNDNGTWNLRCVRANQYPYCQVAFLTNKTAVPGFCKIKCSNVFWKAGPGNTARTIIYVVGWLSFFANLFVVLSYLLDPQKRVFPVLLAIFFSVNYTMFGLVLAINSIAGASKVLCKDDATAHTQSSHFLCGLSAVVSHFSIVSGACWMFMLSLNLVYFMIFSKHLPKWSQIPMHAFSWGFPALLVSIALGKKKYIGGPLMLVVCGMIDFKFYDATLLIPYFTLFGLSIILAAGVVIYITRQTGRKGLWRQSQLLGFLVILSVTEMLGIVLRIHQKKYSSSRYTPQFIHWTACEYAKYLGLVTKCSRPLKHDIAFVAFGHLVQLLGQLMVFVFFGLTRQNLDFWKRVVVLRSWDTISTTSSISRSRSGRPQSEGDTTGSTAEDSKY